MISSYRRILLSAAVAAAALAVAGPALAGACLPPGGISLPFNPIDPTFATQGVSNIGQEGGGTFSCTTIVNVIGGAPQVQIAANIVDVTQSVVVGNDITFDVFQGATQLLNDAVANLSQQVYLLTGPVLPLIDLTIVSSIDFANIGHTGAFSQQYTIATPVPGPVVGGGLAGLIMACGGLLALARRRRQQLAA
jgi:hypothetical protein